MDIKAYIERENREKQIKIDEGTTVGEVLSHLKINPVTVIVAKNNEVVTVDEKLSNGDLLNIISVISGG